MGNKRSVLKALLEVNCQFRWHCQASYDEDFRFCKLQLQLIYDSNERGTEKTVNSKAAHAQNENMEATGYLPDAQYAHPTHVRVTVFIC